MSETVDGGIYWDARSYDILQANPAGNDILFFLEQIRRHGEPVLELGCGTGRVTIALAREGIDVTGLEISEEMLALAREKADAAGALVDWVRADCRNFHLGRKFGVVMFPANSLTHMLDLASLESCFARVREHLTEDGRFIFTLLNPSLKILTRDPLPRTHFVEYDDPDGRGKVVVTENNIYDAATQINHVKWYYKFEATGQELVADLDMRMYYPQEMDALVKYNGFEIEAKYGSFSGSAYGSGSRNQVFVCRAQHRSNSLHGKM